jgi:hypothetical protein
MTKAQSVVGAALGKSPPPRDPRWRQAVVFMVEVLVGTLVFMVLAAAAALINLALGYLAVLGVDGVVRIGLKTAEYALFGTDLALYLRFLWDVVRRK